MLGRCLLWRAGELAAVERETGVRGGALDHLGRRLLSVEEHVHRPDPGALGEEDAEVHAPRLRSTRSRSSRRHVHCGRVGGACGMLASPRADPAVLEYASSLSRGARPPRQVQHCIAQPPSRPPGSRGRRSCRAVVCAAPRWESAGPTKKSIRIRLTLQSHCRNRLLKPQLRRIVAPRGGRPISHQFSQLRSAEARHAPVPRLPSARTSRQPTRRADRLDIVERAQPEPLSRGTTSRWGPTTSAAPGWTGAASAGSRTAASVLQHAGEAGSGGAAAWSVSA